MSVFVTLFHSIALPAFPYHHKKHKFINKNDPIEYNIVFVYVSLIFIRRILCDRDHFCYIYRTGYTVCQVISMCAPRLTLASASLALLLALLAKLVALDYLMHPTFRVHTSGAVVVTGASSGIGEHAAAALHALPGSDFLVFAGVRKDSDAKRLEAKYPGMRTVRLDVTSATSIADAVQTVKGAGLPLIGLVNNAGVQKDLPVELRAPRRPSPSSKCLRPA